MYESSTDRAMNKLKGYLETLPGSEVLSESDRYLRVEFRKKGGKEIDDAEWFFTPNDAIIQFRSARRGSSSGDGGTNLKRMEKIRIALGFEKVGSFV